MNFFHQLRDALGLGEELNEMDYYDDEADFDAHQDPNQPQSDPRSLPSNVIGMPGLSPHQTEMILAQPRSFEEIPQVVNALRERKSVILDLTLMEVEQAQRCADYVAGATYAIDGNCCQIGEGIFLFAPSYVQINNYPQSDRHPPLTPPTPTERSPLPTPGYPQPASPAASQASPQPYTQPYTQHFRYPSIDPSAL